MTRSVGIAELKARLSEFLRAVRGGETITVLDRDQPVARVVPYAEVGHGLVVRQPVRKLAELRVPRRRPSRRTDSLSALRDERRDKR